MIGQIVGVLAAVAIGAGFVPQIWKAYTTKSMDDLSYPMFFLLLTGNALWLGYGIAISDTILILANIFNASCCTTIIGMKYAYSKK